MRFRLYRGKFYKVYVRSFEQLLNAFRELLFNCCWWMLALYMFWFRVSIRSLGLGGLLSVNSHLVGVLLLPAHDGKWISMRELLVFSFFLNMFLNPKVTYGFLFADLGMYYIGTVFPYSLLRTSKVQEVTLKP